MNNLKRNIQNFLFIVEIFCCLHCKSFSNYLEYRRKDLQDTVSLGVEKEAYGFGLRISFFSLGFFFEGKDQQQVGVGLRGGNFGKYYTSQLVFGFLGGENFYSAEVIQNEKGELVFNNGLPICRYTRDNLKSYKVKYLSFYKDPPSKRRKRQREKDQTEIIKDLVKETKDESLLTQLPKENKKPYGYSKEYLYQVEIFLGTYAAVRLGFNFAEVLDFVLGIFSIDILEDDVMDEIQTEDL